MKNKMTFWLVQATVNGVQVPTFYLNADIQGIISEQVCIKVAKDTVDPLHLAKEVYISCDKWVFEV